MNFFFIGDDGKYYRKGTLAHYLDKRVISRGEPTQNDLPATLNPLKFLLDNVFKDRASFIVVDKNCCQDPLDTPAITDILKTCTPAGNISILYIKLNALEDNVDKSLSADNYILIPATQQITETANTKTDSFNISEMRN